MANLEVILKVVAIILLIIVAFVTWPLPLFPWWIHWTIIVVIILLIAVLWIEVSRMQPNR